MNTLTRFCGREPRPASGRILRREGMASLLLPDAALPPGFPDALVREDVLKDSRSVAAFRCGGGRFFAKLYKFRSRMHALKHVFRTPRAFRSFAAAEALAEAGFATPRPVAASVALRFGVVPVRQVLLTEALPPETVFCNREIAAAPDDARALLLLRELAGFAARLHAAGFLHGDLSLRNLYRVSDGRRFGVIDLDGLLLVRTPCPRAAAAGELARIVASAFRCRPELRRDASVTEEVLRAYSEAGGAAIRPEELRSDIRRLVRHRPH